MKKINVVEIFSSVEGEGTFIGYPVTFIRLEGCNLRCEWCDTAYSYSGKNFKEMKISDILMEIKNYPNFRVCLTGGEPFLSENVEILMEEILKKGYLLMVETNGTVFTEKIKNIYLQYKDKIHTVISPKPDVYYFINDYLLNFADEIKFIIDQKIKLDDILKYKKIYKKIPLIFQPQSNRKDMIDKALKFQRELLEKHSIEARVIPQVHKYMG
ncbi:7-carboxy-7-deazaguanine synthase QueE, partial [Persephonella sp.]